MGEAPPPGFLGPAQPPPRPRPAPAQSPPRPRPALAMPAARYLQPAVAQDGDDAE